MYYIYGVSGPSLLVESTDSMITFNLVGCGWLNCIAGIFP